MRFGLVHLGYNSLDAREAEMYRDLVTAAADLYDDEGTSPEYLRAMADLIARVCMGTTGDDVSRIMADIRARSMEE